MLRWALAMLFTTSVTTNITAHATGFCENTPRKYGPPKFFDETTETFAIPATQNWCEETDGVETRGTISFTELRDTKNTVTTILSTARGTAADRVTAILGSVDFVKSIDAELKSRGFKPLARRTAKCTIRSTFTPSKPASGWLTGTLAIEVRLGLGAQTLARVDAGTAASDRRSDVAIAANFSKTVVALFARVPTCGGPPPGYFGPDDGGDCYASDEAFVTRIEATTLAACF